MFHITDLCAKDLIHTLYQIVRFVISSELIITEPTYLEEILAHSTFQESYQLLIIHSFNRNPLPPSPQLICRTEIRNTLKDNMAPNDDSKRLHRKSQNGCLSFVEMGKLMAASWKAIDSFSKSVFEELAQEGRIIHKELVAEYEKVRGSPPATKRRATTKSAKNSKRPPSQEYVRRL